MKFLKATSIDFIGAGKFWLTASAVVLIAGVVAIFVKGPMMGIDFTGGTLVQISFKELPPIDQVRSSLDADGWSGYTLQTQPEDNSVIVRLKQGEQSKEDISGKLIGALKKSFAGNVSDVVDRIEFVGPVIGKKLAIDALLAIFGSLAVIVIYVAIRFKSWLWGTVGVLALAHDVFVTFSVLVITGREITLVIVAALLTLAGYSINDTIVIFDRVRENLRSARKEGLRELLNRSLNETLARSINTSMTTLLAAAALLLGGQVIRDFAISMTIGVIIGAYSSLFLCPAIVFYWETRGKKRA